MGHPLVSVIIPVHNTEKYLPQCLETVFAQTLTDFEVICVDDGSTDSSLKILQKYQKKDSRLKIYRADNVGVSVARNIALSKATGKYIAFIDSDDFAHSQLLSKTTAQAEKTDADIVIFLYRDEYYNKEDTEKPGECEVIVAKHRSGPTGSVDVAWIERYTQFKDKASGNIPDAGGMF